jgi:polyhydroxybutyrate depolymerase
MTMNSSSRVERVRGYSPRPCHSERHDIILSGSEGSQWLARGSFAAAQDDRLARSCRDLPILVGKPHQRQKPHRLSAFTWLVIVCTLVVPALAGCDLFPSPTTSSKHTATSAFPPSAFPPYADTLPVNTIVPTTGCDHAALIKPGSSADETIRAHPAESEGFATRRYRLHVPATYQADRPTPVVLIFHGHGGSAAGMEGTGFSQLADRQNFLAVYPQGLPQGAGGPSFWADIGPIDFGIDDVLFVSDLLTTLQKEFCVDAHRIYATGFSNGGGMTWFLACRLAGRIAAFAPVSGDHYAPPGGCQPGRPVSVLEINGTVDQLVPYNGVSIKEAPAWPEQSIPDLMQTWAARDGCTAGPVVFLQDARTVGEQWTGCKGQTVVMHYRMVGEGHSWPARIGTMTGTEAIWQFLSAHPLPATS